MSYVEQEITKKPHLLIFLVNNPAPIVNLYITGKDDQGIREVIGCVGLSFVQCTSFWTSTIWQPDQQISFGSYSANRHLLHSNYNSLLYLASGSHVACSALLSIKAPYSRNSNATLNLESNFLRIFHKDLPV